MQPDIISRCLMKGYFLVLATILADQDGKAILALDMQRHTTSWQSRFPFGLLPSFALLRSLLPLFVFFGLAP
jgi:hypothetical protein